MIEYGVPAQWKKRLPVMLGIVLTGFLVLGWLLFPHLQTWRMKQSALYLEESQNWVEAARWYSRILQRRPDDVFARERLAVLSSRVDSLSEMECWRRFYEGAPERFAARFGYARVSMEEGQTGQAAELLKSFSGEERRRPEVLLLFSRVAMATGVWEQARNHLEALLEMEPENRDAQLLFLEVLLKQRRSGDGENVNRLLQSLMADEQTLFPAKKALIESMVEFGEGEAAIPLSAENLQHPDAEFSDFWRHLLLLTEFQPQVLGGFLTTLDDFILDQPARLVKVVEFLISAGHARKASHWLPSLTELPEDNFYRKVAKVDLLMAQGELTSAEQHLERETWGANEAYRLALRARLAEMSGETARSRSYWSQALGAVGNDDLLQLNLARALMGWGGWDAEAEQLFWDILDRGILVEVAWSHLKTILGKRKDLDGLFRLTRKMRERYPEEANNLNDFVMYALLLGTREEEAMRLSRRLYEARPSQILPVSTYAFALFYQGRHREALEVMNRLSASALQIPEIAHYYGLILYANGLEEEAQPYLVRGQQGNLLEEERQLLERLRAGDFQE